MDTDVSPPQAATMWADPLALVAALTCTRDRETIDATLLAALLALPGVAQVRLWRAMGEPGTRRHWLLCGQREHGDGGRDVGADDVREWAPWDEKGAYRDCLESGEVRVEASADAATCRTLLPMAGQLDLAGVVELAGPAALAEGDLRRAIGVLQVHGNHLGLLDYSERDTLTGLLNRKSFDETFMHATVAEATRLYGTADQISAAERRQGGMRQHWLGVIDIDHFKLINDRFGHIVGDDALAMVASLMRRTFRYDDRLYRFGGEEFVVLLTSQDASGAMTAFNRFRRAIEQHEFIGIGRVTVSIGFSDVRPGDTPQACFDRADRAVYHGKTNGRNQVQSHEVLVAQGILEDTSHFGEIELF
jgi:diguanylate cyclase (GGDEF)-like protein